MALTKRTYSFIPPDRKSAYGFGMAKIFAASVRSHDEVFLLYRLRPKATGKLMRLMCVRYSAAEVASCLPKYAGDTSFASKFTDEDMQALFGGIVFAQTMPLATGETPADSLMIVPVDERWMRGGRVSDGLDSLFPADGGYGTPQEMTAAQYEPFKCEKPNERNEAE